MYKNSLACQAPRLARGFSPDRTLYRGPPDRRPFPGRGGSAHCRHAEERRCRRPGGRRTMAMKIYTRTGDQGETGLFGGGRVPKDHPRVAAYGDVDELSSTIGVARATAPIEFFDPLLESVQRDLFAIGGQLASPEPEKVAKALEKADLSGDRAAEFERVMDEADLELPPSVPSCCRVARPRPRRCIS